ncbi:MAG: carboxypeptidase-like regulatory domain-containing protein [Muribaculaceae bacterium]|nr:carboxypeptidase-like regulatory domain-containing protein [Muribaculaceae bacterium]
MQMLFKTGVSILLGAMLSFGFVSCSDHDVVDATTIPSIAAVHNISGSVAGINGKGIQGATVELSGDAKATVTTDANGYFIFPDVKPGKYHLTVSAEGKTSKEKDITIVDNGKGQNIVWNVMLSSIDASKNITVTDQGGEGETETEALEGNDLAEIEVDVDIDSKDLSKEAVITITPIYTPYSDEISRAVKETLLVGAEISCSDPEVKIVNPIDLTFNVDEETAAQVTAKKLVNDSWVVIQARKENGKVIIPADEFTSYGLFAPVDFTSSAKWENLTLSPQSLFDNTESGRPMQVGTVTYEYGVGMEITSKGETVFKALLIEALAREYGANAFKTTGEFPINITLPIGTFLQVTAQQAINNVAAACAGRKVEGIQYGDVNITTTTGDRDHTGGASRPN